MSLVTVKYEILISGIYPFNGEYKKNGFKITSHYVDEEKVNAIFEMGIFYLSPYLGFCCYPDESKKPVYLTFDKEISFDIDYGTVTEYDREFTTNFLQKQNLYDEINDLEKVMTLEINNHIRFPIKIIKAFNPEGEMIAMVCNVEKTNTPSLLNVDVNIVRETMKRQENRMGCGFSYESIVELKNNNEFFDNALSIYFSSFSVADEKVGFILLVTAVESLLNLSTYTEIQSCEKCGQPMFKIRATIAENVSLILMDRDESIKKEIKKLYDKRSKFVHSGIRDITSNDEQKMQEYVRKILLMYWHTSMQISSFDHKAIIAYIHSEEYRNSILCKTFLTALENLTFKEIQSQMFNEILGGILNGTLKISNEN